jgi:hypothetical protein
MGVKCLVSGITGQVPSGLPNMLQAQSSGKLNLWQGCHEIAEKSSKIVPLGAPLYPYIGEFRKMKELTQFVLQFRMQRNCWRGHGLSHCRSHCTPLRRNLCAACQLIRYQLQ